MVLDYDASGIDVSYCAGGDGNKHNIACIEVAMRNDNDGEESLFISFSEVGELIEKLKNVAIQEGVTL